MDIQRSFAVFTMATILTFLGMLIISATENGVYILQVFLKSCLHLELVDYRLVSQVILVIFPRSY